MVHRVTEFQSSFWAAKDSTWKDEDQGQGSSRGGGAGVEKEITLMGSPTASGSLPSSSSVPQPQGCLPCPGPTPQPAARPSIHKALLEVATESLALIALDLSVLDSPALQEVVHLRGVDGSRPLLILGRGLANPVVDVIGQVAARLMDLGRGNVQCA